MCRLVRRNLKRYRTIHKREVFALLSKSIVVFLLLTACIAFGQSARHRQRKKARSAHPYSSSNTKSSEVVRLTEKLRAHGATVVLTREKVSQPFFSVAGRIINVDGEA